MHQGIQYGKNYIKQLSGGKKMESIEKVGKIYDRYNKAVNKTKVNDTKK